MRAGKLAGDGRDVALALGILAIIAMLLLPLPGWLLDLGLATSISLSVMILMTSLFIEKPLQLSAFPTILLIATMLRLGLNIASTRLILSNGHSGPGAAGSIIHAFGSFLMGGNTVIGLTVFAILMIINFIVITKGAGRIAEVAARFSLDAMPGKQMAIDAELNTGAIGESQARERRAEVEAESAFFGAMDGASKFVRGDAVAGLAITAINILVGLGIGVFSHDMAFGDAFKSYTLLTVGDGLVSQIPALTVSTAAGMLVSKAGVAGPAQQALFEQLSRYPQALAVSAAMLGLLSLLPGLPFLPFALLAGGIALLLWRVRVNRRNEAATLAASARAAEPMEDPVTVATSLDPLRIEVGYGLLPLLDGGDDTRLDLQVRALRRQLASDLGFVLPQVRITENLALSPDDYRVTVKDNEVGRGTLRPGRLLVLDPDGSAGGLGGEAVREPVFGLDARWIERGQRDEAGLRGLTVVEPAAVVSTHLTELIRDNIGELLSYDDVQKLLDALPAGARKLAGDLIPTRLAATGLQRVLRALLAENVAIRDLPAILEGLSDGLAAGQPPAGLIEHVRQRLSRQITSAYADGGAITAIALSADWEAAFADALTGQGYESELAMAPADVRRFGEALAAAFDGLPGGLARPVLIASAGIRPYVRALVERARPLVAVLSYGEVHPRTQLRIVGQL